MLSSFKFTCDAYCFYAMLSPLVFFYAMLTSIKFFLWDIFLYICFSLFFSFMISPTFLCHAHISFFIYEGYVFVCHPLPSTLCPLLNFVMWLIIIFYATLYSLTFFMLCSRLLFFYAMLSSLKFIYAAYYFYPMLTSIKFGLWGLFFLIYMMTWTWRCEFWLVS